MIHRGKRPGVSGWMLFLAAVFGLLPTAVQAQGATIRVSTPPPTDWALLQRKVLRSGATLEIELRQHVNKPSQAFAWHR